MKTDMNFYQQQVEKLKTEEKIPVYEGRRQGRTFDHAKVIAEALDNGETVLTFGSPRAIMLLKLTLNQLGYQIALTKAKRRSRLRAIFDWWGRLLGWEQKEDEVILYYIENVKKV